MHGHDEPEVSTGDPARLLAIRRHLASFLPVSLIERFWHDGFASTRQPSFRLNALRLHNRGDRGGGGISGGDGVVRELLSGFGLPSDTPVERCPYHPLARLLPSRTAAAVRVAQQVHELRPLRAGAVYFMGLSSMLPALALMAHPNHPNHSNHYNHHRHRHQMVRPQQQWPTPHDDSKHGNRSGSSDGISDGVAGAVGARPLRVLDLCAAPGGKTALLAELLGNRGTLLAVDSSWPRLQRLQFNVERLVPNHHNDFNLRNGRNHLNDSCARVVGDGDGARRSSEAREAAAAGATRPWWRRGCVVAVHADGTRLRVDEHGLPLLGSRTVRRRGSRGGGADELEDDDEGEIGVYDRILVDAPCSGLGRLQLQRPSSYSRWDEQHVARHPERQRQLLLRGVRLLRRGGSLVYSTCTIDPRENEAPSAVQPPLRNTAGNWLYRGRALFGFEEADCPSLIDCVSTPSEPQAGGGTSPLPTRQQQQRRSAPSAQLRDRIEELLPGRVSAARDILRQHGTDESYHEPLPPDLVVFPE
ncbi:hypothetical protein VOLCADRAFT_95449, partial [Volvox carteri f. nagariensis]